MSLIASGCEVREIKRLIKFLKINLKTQKKRLENRIFR